MTQNNEDYWYIVSKKAFEHYRNKNGLQRDFERILDEMYNRFCRFLRELPQDKSFALFQAYVNEDDIELSTMSSSGHYCPHAISFREDENVFCFEASGDIPGLRGLQKLRMKVRVLVADYDEDYNIDYQYCKERHKKVCQILREVVQKYPEYFNEWTELLL